MDSRQSPLPYELQTDPDAYRWWGYTTMPGTIIDMARQMIVTYTHRGQIGSWFTFRYCQEVYAFPQDADARAIERIPACQRQRYWRHMPDGSILRPGMRAA